VSLGYPAFSEAKDDGGDGDNWSYKSCKSSSQIITTNKPTSSFFYRPDALPVAQPTVSKHWTEKYLYYSVHIPWTCLPQAHLGVSQLCLWPLTDGVKYSTSLTTWLQFTSCLLTGHVPVVDAARCTWQNYRCDRPVAELTDVYCTLPA